jgi:mono/diheme cytochrome c family protein
MRRTAVILSSFVLLFLAACGEQETDLGDPATLGQRTFTSWCVPCHGANGEGFINALDAPALNADGESYLLTDEQILTAIIDGGAASGGAMSPLGDFLSEEQEMAVLYYVHTLWTAEQQAAHEAAGGHIPPTPVPPSATQP